MSRSRGAKAVPLVRIGRYPPYTEGIYGAEQKDLRGCNRQLRITKNQQSLAIKGFERDFSTYVCLVFTYVFPL